MISNDNLIWGFRSHLSLPFPFDDLTNKRGSYVDNAGNVQGAVMVQGVVKAAMILAYLEESVTGKPTNQFKLFDSVAAGTAIGTRSNPDGSESVYVEKKSENRKCTDIVKYDPSSGHLSGVFYDDDVSRRVKPYKIKGSGGTDGTAIFLALFDELKRSDLETSEVYEEFKAVMRNDLWSPSDVEPVLFHLSDCFYRKLAKNETIKVSLTVEEELPTLTKTNIDRGYDGPSKGKVTYGNFNVLKVGERKSSAEKKKNIKMLFEQAGKLNFVKTEKDFSDYEKAMVPEISPIHVVSKEEEFIVSEIVSTFDDDLNAIKTIMLLGMSSSGKSHLAETLAARLHRPYSAPLTCTPNMDETTLLGTTLPVIGSGRDNISKEDNLLLDKIYESTSPEESLNILQLSLGIPDTEVMLFDPEGAYEEMTGKAVEKITSSEVVRLAECKITGKLNELVSNLPSGDGVKYMYYKSPLVKAIENGWMIEIQEFNVVKEAAMFASLNNVFDKEGNGILETPYGQVHRHPDFRAVYTANPNYAGCRDPHQSVIARSDMVVTMNNPAQKVMKERIKNRMKFEDDDLLANVVETFISVTDKAQEISCNGEATMRELYRFASAINRGVDPELAIENYVINSITRDEDDKAELLETAGKSALMLM